MCRRAFEQKQMEPPCEGCENARPFLLPGNEDAWELFCLCSSQLIVGMNGAIGINYMAIYKVAETFGIEVTPAVFNKIRTLEKQMRKEGEKKWQNQTSK